MKHKPYTKNLIKIRGILEDIEFSNNKLKEYSKFIDADLRDMEGEVLEIELNAKRILNLIYKLHIIKIN